MRTVVSTEMAPLDWNRIRAVVSDYGGVLTFAPADEDWQAMAATMRVPLPCLLEGYWKHRLPYEVAHYSSAKYWGLIAQGCGTELSDATVLELVRLDNEQWGRANPAAIELMRLLRGAGIRTAILSNIQPDMLRFVEAVHSWINEFDARVYSCKVGIAKPVAEIFLYSARMLEMRPEDCLFLDDREDNVEGAQQAGMQGVRVDSTESLIMVKAGLLRTVCTTRR